MLSLSPVFPFPPRSLVHSRYRSSSGFPRKSWRLLLPLPSFAGAAVYDAWLFPGARDFGVFRMAHTFKGLCFHHTSYCVQYTVPYRPTYSCPYGGTYIRLHIACNVAPYCCVYMQKYRLRYIMLYCYKRLCLLSWRSQIKKAGVARQPPA